MTAIEQEWLVDLCICGHHITAHAKGRDACRYHPGDCAAYRWDEVGIRRVPTAVQADTDEKATMPCPRDGSPCAAICGSRGICGALAVRAAPAATRPADGVDPAEIVRQRAAGWPDMHPEDFCHRCGRPNPTWFADTAEWQIATGSTSDGGGILCPSCFCALWEQVTGKTAIIWRVSIDPRSRDAS